MTLRQRNITIVGLGLIGGSYAMALRELKPKNLWAVDVDENTLKAAEQLGVIDKGYVDPQIPIKNSDITILCLYPDLVFDFVNKNAALFKKGSIITDTVGVKGILLEKVNAVLCGHADFIGGHPMAGKECSGFSVASKDIFLDANYILTPEIDNQEENIVLIETIAKKIGCKNVVRVTSKKHDELIAFTSHLPHVIASAMMGNPLLEEAKLFAGGSFRDATRVALINSELWSQLLIDNREQIINQIEIFENNIKDIKRAIAENDKALLKTLFQDVRMKKEKWLQ